MKKMKIIKIFTLAACFLVGGSLMAQTPTSGKVSVKVDQKQKPAVKRTITTTNTAAKKEVPVERQAQAQSSKKNTATNPQSKVITLKRKQTQVNGKLKAQMRKQAEQRKAKKTVPKIKHESGKKWNKNH